MYKTSRKWKQKIYEDPVCTMNVYIDDVLINNALTVAEVNKMMIGTLNGIKIKSLSRNDGSFEMIPIRSL